MLNTGSRKNSRSQYKGVSWWAPVNRWRARITIDRKVVTIGRFLTELEAAAAYDRLASEHHGEYAKLNFPVITELVATHRPKIVEAPDWMSV